MFTRNEFEMALWIATGRGAHEELESLYNAGHERPGRKVVTAAAFLVGLLLACDEYGNVKLRRVVRVLRALPKAWLQELGMDTVTEAQIYRYSARLTRAADFSVERAPQVAEDCRRWRKYQMIRISDALIAATLIPRPNGGVDYAIDSTGVWSNKIGHRSNATALEAELDEDHIRSEQQAEADAASDMDMSLSEANWGHKTPKHGESEKFFGFDVHALIRVGPPSLESDAETRPEPNLVEGLSVVAGGTDIVEPALSIIDRVLKREQLIRYLFADRHYSYKKVHRWRLPLNQRGIKPIFDMHKIDQGFRLHDGIPYAAGHPHCPRVPQDLGVIPTLAPNASNQQKEIFEKRIEQRHDYAAKIHTPLDQSGKVRFQCPALDNKVGCPLRPGTMAMAFSEGLPVIQNPPDTANAPKICTQTTFGLDIEDPRDRGVLKNHQNPIWGTRQWRKFYNRRAYIEGWFGTVKDTVGLKRRNIRLNGIAMNWLAISVFTALANKRHLRNWHNETGLGPAGHPLLFDEHTNLREAV
jgi:hypothetical protein